VAAQLEKIIVAADLRNPEQRRPDARDNLFYLRLRCDVLGRSRGPAFNLLQRRERGVIGFPV
jgi:hypothetical protein